MCANHVCANHVCANHVSLLSAGVATSSITTESVAAALAAAVAACWSGSRLAEAAGMPDASLAAMALVASLIASCGGAASKRWATPGRQGAPFAGKPLCTVLCCTCQKCWLGKPEWQGLQFHFTP